MLPSSAMDESIIKTLAYADIFNYPLTKLEIFQFLIGKKAELLDLKKPLLRLEKQGIVRFENNLFFLKGRQQIVALRLKRSVLHERKIKTARKAARILQVLPQIKLIGISGGVAVSNADENDDIDFFIITAAGQLWTTRLLATAVLTFSGRRRTPQSDKLKDKICLNMFIDERQLEIVPHDLYLAHEVLQMQPIFDRQNSYRKFILSNLWVYNFLPNWPKIVNFPKKLQLETTRSKLSFSTNRFLYFEKLAKKFQLNYMAKRRTVEKITSTKLQFHPKNIHKEVLETYFKRLGDFK